MIENKNTVIGEAGGGMVKVHMNANMIITRVEIDKTVFADTVPEIIDDLDFMADLFRAATNSALDKCFNNSVNSLSQLPLEKMLGNFNGK